MMLSLPASVRIWLATRATDFSAIAAIQSGGKGFCTGLGVRFTFFIW